MNTPKTKGFTLIELLVVIAIIAILAAILFPVFAQAKLSAKKAASLSTVKQIGTSAQIYMADNDDLLPLAQSGEVLAGMNSANGNTATRGFSWKESLFPYIKSLQMFVDPVRGDLDAIFTGGPTSSGLTSYRNQNRFPQFGYNYIYLSPFRATSLAFTEVYAVGKSLTSAVKPAQTIMLTESRNPWLDSRGSYLLNAPGAWPNIAPHDWYLIYYYANTTGTTADWTPSGDWAKNTAPYTAQAYCGGRDGGSNVVRLDSSAKFLNTGALTAGTNYATAPGATAAGVGTTINDKARYNWNLDDTFYENNTG